MSFSYTVGGKSRTHTQLGNRGQDQEKEESNRAKNSTLSPTKSPGTARPGGKRNLTGVQAGSNRRVGAKSRPQAQRTAGASIGAQQTSTIVTLSDLKNQQSKPQSSVNLKPAKSKSNSAIDLGRDHSGPGRKLGGHIISDSKLSIARKGVGVRNQPISPNRPIKSENSEHLHSRTSALNSNSNYHTPAPTAVLQTRGSQVKKKTPNVNRTSNKLIDPTLNSNKTSSTSSQPSPGKGRGSRGRGSLRGGMAYNNNNSRYTSSSLYSANPRQVGQRPPDEEEEDTRQRQGEPGPSQGSPQQPQQQGESPGAFRVIQPNASKRQQLLNKSSQEMKALEDYRASKKPTTIRGEARCAGGSKSEEEARMDLEKQHRNKKYEQILKKEQRNREKREREDKEFQEKKAKARQTAEENARRRNVREVNFLRDEHATTNDRFLRRFDAERTPPRSETSVSQSSKLQQLREMFPNKKPAKLQKLLEDNNNDVAQVADLLMD